MNALTFTNVCVGPTEAILQKPVGSLFRGGPMWPDFDEQIIARQCRGREIKVVDDKPTFDTSTSIYVDAGIWCGPIVFHFGHMIADFGMRVALSANLDPALPLVFSGFDLAAKRSMQEPPSYFWAMIDHLKIDRKRIFVVRQPTLFRKLYVYPQAERMYGPVPASAYLDLLDEITFTSVADRADRIKKVYVSRSNFLLGGLAGETYLDRILEASGVKVIYPETLPLSVQVSYYKAAETLVFSEGSAVHALQLLGRLDADIGILVRRSKARIAQNSVMARARSLKYLEASPELVYGLRLSGLPNESKGITLLNGHGLIERFSTMGIDIGKNWNDREFAQQQETDLKAWVTLRLTNPKAHPGERAAIQSSLAKLTCPILLGTIIS